MRSRTALGLSLLMLSTQARADCDQADLVDRLARQLHPAQQLGEGLSACKVWPHDPSLTIVTLVLVREHEEPAYYEYDMHLLLVKSGTQEVVSSYLEPGTWTSDAVRLTAVSIDTGRFQVSPTLRAFGVKVSYVGSSRPNPFDAETLSLFVAEAGRIVPVLQDLKIAERHGEWDTYCSGEFETRTRTISVAPQPNGSHADLVIAEAIEQRTSSMADGECKDSVQKSTQRSVVKFVHGKYAVPEQLRFE